jgi:imidazole glycerol-phosphate synthase subunit HisH
MIGIVDYGMGNLLSVRHAIEWLGVEVKVCQDPQMLSEVERLVLPGVGAFRDCMKNLRNRGFVEILQEFVIEKGMPILGICLGMQAMALRSYEGGEHEGLGWFDAEVVRLQPSDPAMRVPHVGWNEVICRQDSPIFAGLPTRPDFYFVHSYYMKCSDEADVEAQCDYDGLFTASVRKNNIVATQFHPEKSQDYGLKVLENFLKWNP